MADGGGLYLQVAQGGTKPWLLRYMRDGMARQMGLGSVTAFSLKEARERARQFRQQLADDIDPDRRAAWPPDARQGRSGEADDLQGSGRALHRRAPCRMEEREARRAMDGDARDLRLSRHRRPVRRGHRNRARPEGSRADLDDEDGDRQSRAGAHRGRARLGEGARSAAGRQPGALARPSRQAASGQNEGAAGRAPRRACRLLPFRASWRGFGAWTACRRARWSSPS